MNLLLNLLFLLFCLLRVQPTEANELMGEILRGISEGEGDFMSAFASLIGSKLKKKMDAAFEVMDTNEDGQLSPTELSVFLSTFIKVDNGTLWVTLDKFDKNGDGKLDIDEAFEVTKAKPENIFTDLSDFLDTEEEEEDILKDQDEESSAKSEL